MTHIYYSIFIMNEEKDKNNTIAITTFIIGVLPIIYILSIGPVAFFYQKYNISGTTYWKYIISFYTPVTWLHDNTPLKKPLENYVELFYTNPLNYLLRFCDI